MNDEDDSRNAPRRSTRNSQSRSQRASCLPRVPSNHHAADDATRRQTIARGKRRRVESEQEMNMIRTGLPSVDSLEANPSVGAVEAPAAGPAANQSATIESDTPLPLALLTNNNEPSYAPRNAEEDPTAPLLLLNHSDAGLPNHSQTNFNGVSPEVLLQMERARRRLYRSMDTPYPWNRNGNGNRVSRQNLIQRENGPDPLRADRIRQMTVSVPSSSVSHQEDAIPLHSLTNNNEPFNMHALRNAEEIPAAAAPFLLPNHSAADAGLPNHAQENLNGFSPGTLPQMARRRFVVVRRAQNLIQSGNRPGPSLQMSVSVPSSGLAALHQEDVIRDIPLVDSLQQYSIPAQSRLRIIPGDSGQHLLRAVRDNPSDGGNFYFFRNSSDTPRLVSIRVGRNEEGRLSVDVRVDRENATRERNQIVPLEPTIVPENQQDIATDHLDDDDDKLELERYTCGVCYEYMEQPSSCGQCAGRFCKICLLRVKHSQRGICPICRRPIENIQHDAELSQEMDKITIPCRYQGCTASLTLRHVSPHEQLECRMVNVFCRFKEYGCTWKGRRGELQHHEDENCVLTKVSALVDRMRTMAAETESTVRGLSARVTAFAVAANQEREMMRQHVARSPSNPIDVASFVIQVTCCSPHLIRVKDAWTSLYSTTAARAAVFNLLALTPTYVLVGRLVWVQYAKCASVLHHPQFLAGPIDDEIMNEFLESIAGLIALTLVAMLIVLSLNFDNQSSEEWGSFQVPFTSQKVPIMLYVTAAGFFLMYNVIFRMVGGFFLPAFVAMTICTASSLLPNVIASFSCKLSRADLLPRSVFPGRVGIPLSFGLQYSFIVYATDAVSCLDVLCLYHILDEVFKRFTGSLGYKGLFFEWPPFIDLLYVSIRVGQETKSFFLDDCDDAIGRNYASSSGALVLIPLVNVIVAVLAIVSQLIGMYHHQAAESSHLNDFSTYRKANAIGLGLLAVAMCSYILLATF